MSGASLLFSARLFSQRTVAKSYGGVALQNAGGGLGCDLPHQKLNDASSSTKHNVKLMSSISFSARYASSSAKSKRCSR